jgi:acetylornithine deacetylase
MEEAALKVDIHQEITARREQMLLLLQSSLRCASVSGAEMGFVRLLADWAVAEGFEVDEWIGDEQELIARFGALPRHLPLTHRPTLHIGLKGNAARRSLLFNGHTDVVDVSDSSQWRHDPWGGITEGSLVYGRGACDVKGPIVAALWAMQVLQKLPAEQRGDVAIELVPGEEDCVGLGTLTSIARGHGADGVVVLEPTEGLPRCASRGGCRFEITASGRAVHGTVKWLGVDAIAIMQKVLASLANIEQRWNDRSADSSFSSYPIARPITVDRIEGGGWQGMICDKCVCAGYLELLPGDNLADSKEKLQVELSQELCRMDTNPDRVRIQYSEEYSGHRTSPEDAFCRAAEECIPAKPDAMAGFRWRGFNSGCEAGVRANLLGMPTIVWGPGSLEHAHATNEQIDFCDVQLAAECFAKFALNWVQLKEKGICYPSRAQSETTC